MTNQNKIAILVGAGAVENAWEPILTCFRPINGNETDADTANFLFAKSICAMRLYSKSPKGAGTVKGRTGIGCKYEGRYLRCTETRPKKRHTKATERVYHYIGYLCFK